MSGTTKKFLPVGNAATMRETLELASRVIHCAIAADILKGDDAQAAFFACRNALAEQSEPQGNAAKMREAVVKCYQLAYGWEFNEREGTAGVSEPDSAETLFEIQSITTDALAARLRNCDLYPDWEEAYLKWAIDVQEVDPAYVFDIGDDTHERVEESWGIFAPDQNREFVDWYMSPAELDAKGGAE